MFVFPYTQNYLVNNYILDTQSTSITAYHLYVQCISFDRIFMKLKVMQLLKTKHTNSKKYFPQNFEL